MSPEQIETDRYDGFERTSSDVFGNHVNDINVWDEESQQTQSIHSTSNQRYEVVNQLLHEAILAVSADPLDDVLIPSNARVRQMPNPSQQKSPLSVELQQYANPAERSRKCGNKEHDSHSSFDWQANFEFPLQDLSVVSPKAVRKWGFPDKSLPTEQKIPDNRASCGQVSQDSIKLEQKEEMAGQAGHHSASYGGKRSKSNQVQLSEWDDLVKHRSSKSPRGTRNSRHSGASDHGANGPSRSQRRKSDGSTKRSDRTELQTGINEVEPSSFDCQFAKLSVNDSGVDSEAKDEKSIPESTDDEQLQHLLQPGSKKERRNSTGGKRERRHSLNARRQRRNSMESRKESKKMNGFKRVRGRSVDERGPRRWSLGSRSKLHVSAGNQELENNTRASTHESVTSGSSCDASLSPSFSDDSSNCRRPSETGSPRQSPNNRIDEKSRRSSASSEGRDVAQSSRRGSTNARFRKAKSSPKISKEGKGNEDASALPTRRRSKRSDVDKTKRQSLRQPNRHDDCNPPRPRSMPDLRVRKTRRSSRRASPTDEHA